VYIAYLIRSVLFDKSWTLYSSDVVVSSVRVCACLLCSLFKWCQCCFERWTKVDTCACHVRYFNNFWVDIVHTRRENTSTVYNIFAVNLLGSNLEFDWGCSWYTESSNPKYNSEIDVHCGVVIFHLLCDMQVVNCRVTALYHLAAPPDIVNKPLLGRSFPPCMWWFHLSICRSLAICHPCTVGGLMIPLTFHFGTETWGGIIVSGRLRLVTVCLQLMEILEIYWTLKSFLKILGISWNSVVHPGS